MLQVMKTDFSSSLSMALFFIRKFMSNWDDCRIFCWKNFVLERSVSFFCYIYLMFHLKNFTGSPSEDLVSRLLKI